MRFALLALFVAAPLGAYAQPLFPNSVASNDLDFIRTDDPGVCWSIDTAAGGRTEMYDPRRDTLFVEDALHFVATYPGQTIRIHVHPAVGDPQGRAAAVASALSRLPDRMRAGLGHVNILDGDGTAWAEDLGRFITYYDGLIARRLADDDLEETSFHETAHVVLDPVITADPNWTRNQTRDAAFVTQYAADNPDTEDIAESTLFAWTMTFHPGRLPPKVEAAVADLMPNRLDYLRNRLHGFEPPAPCTP